MRKLLFVTTLLAVAAPAFAQQAGMQSPAYAQCTALASSDPAQALVKADSWLKIDTGVAPLHCRAMALFGLKRFEESGDALNSARDAAPATDLTLRSYLAHQAVQAYLTGNAPDKAYALFNRQLNDLGGYRGDNALAARLTSDVLLERARLNITYGKLNDAAKDLDHAVSLTPVNEEVLLERANVFEKIGDRSLAKSDVESVLAINHSNAQARLAYDRLNGQKPALQGNAVAPNATAMPVIAPSPQDAANAAPVMAVTSSASAPAQPGAPEDAPRATPLKHPAKKKAK